MAQNERKQVETMPADLAGAPQDANRHAPHPDDHRRIYGGFIGTSPAMLRVYEQIEHAARSLATIFVTGESGTGKEVCAHAIHALGERAKGPFVPINCAAIPRDLMESELFGHVKGAFTGAISDRDGAAALAGGGTLFLDEIAEITPAMQTKLLRFLQDSCFVKVGGSRQERTDARIICATNRDPLAEIRAGRLREDLFYRLHVVPIALPPLRLRGADILDLAGSFLRRFATEEKKSFDGFAPDAEQFLLHYDWPGNVRQLQNVVRHVVVMRDGGAVGARDLPAELLHAAGAGGPAPESAETRLHPAAIRPLAEVEREAIEHAITLYGGNVARAAMALGISPSTIYRKKAAWDGCGPAPALSAGKDWGAMTRRDAN